MRLIAIIAFLTLTLYAGNAGAVEFKLASSPASSSSYDGRTFDQLMTSMENGAVMLDSAIGRLAGRAEMLGQLTNADYSLTDISTYNGALKNICNESRYNELKLKYPGARPTMPGDLVDEYGDYIGPGASYGSGEPRYDDDLMFLVCGEEAGSAEIIGQITEASYYGNETNKIDKATFTKDIDLCNFFIKDYNKLIKAHCFEHDCSYDEHKIEEFKI